MSTKSLHVLFLLIFFFACGQNAESAISTASQKLDINTVILKTEKSGKAVFAKKKKWQFRQWLKEKFTREKPHQKSRNKKSNSKNGYRGILFFALSIFFSALFKFPYIFILGLLACMIFGIIGLFKDKKKAWAIAALIITGLTIVLFLRIAIRIRNQDP